MSCYFFPLGDRLDPTAVNILQQIIELGSETHDATAVASVVAMAPGTVTVVKQVRFLCPEGFVSSSHCPSSPFCFQNFALPSVEFEMKLVLSPWIIMGLFFSDSVCTDVLEKG